MLAEMSNTETRYFKLPFTGMYSKVTQKKSETFLKVKLVFTSNKLRQTFSYEHSPFIQAFSVQRLFINSSVLAVMLVVLVKHTDISQPGLMNTLVRRECHIYTNT